MRIYTEVIFKWDDKQDKLVETSSKSFDYSGEMALCGKGDWHTKVYYDLAGNEWKVRGLEGWFNEIGRVHYYKNGVEEKKDSTPPGDNAWSHQEVEFRSWVYDRSDFVKSDANRLFHNEDQWQAAYKAEYHVDPSGTDITANVSFTDAVADGTITWSEETKTWTGLSEGGEIIDVEEAIDVEHDLTEEQAIIKSETDAELKRLASEWGKIIDIEQTDEFQSAIEEAVETIVEAEEDMYTAFTDMDDDIDDAKSTYQKSIERLTGEEGSYTRDVEQLEVDKTEGLEEIVLTREEELEAIREEGLGGIRAAEAKIGAAGFSSTGVGRTAREMLAEDIGKEARDVDVGFTEERGDISTGYETDLENLRIAKDEALESYKDIRDEAVSDRAWKSKTTSWERLHKDLPDIITEQAGLAEVQLEKLGGRIEEEIRFAREGFGESEEGAIPGYDPFALDGALYGGEYDFLQPGFAESGNLLGMKFDPTFAEGLFGADQYSTYEPGEDFIPYQPDFLTDLGFGAEEERKEEEDVPLRQYDEYGRPIIPGLLEPPKKSDINVKKDITRVSKLKNGIPVYLFRYKWSDKMSVGVMAQDVEKILPEAVVEVDGIKAVNYSILNKKV